MGQAAGGEERGGEGAPSAAPAPGERAWGPGLGPATRRAAPPHQAATGLWPCPLAQGAGPGSPRGLCGHLRGPSGDPTPSATLADPWEHFGEIVWIKIREIDPLKTK